MRSLKLKSLIRFFHIPWLIFLRVVSGFGVSFRSNLFSRAVMIFWRASIFSSRLAISLAAIFRSSFRQKSNFRFWDANSSSILCSIRSSVSLMIFAWASFCSLSFCCESFSRIWRTWFFSNSAWNWEFILCVFSSASQSCSVRADSSAYSRARNFQGNLFLGRPLNF